MEFVNDPVIPCRRGAIASRRLAALYGDLATRESSHQSTDAFVDAFVAANKDAFGVDDVALDLIDIVPIRNGDFKSYSFRQLMEGLPVAHGVVNILVQLGSPDTIAHVGMSLVQPPIGGFPTETLDAEAAVSSVMNHEAWDYLDTFDPYTAAEHVVLETPDMKVYRTWQFNGWDEDESYRFYVDAASGDVVKVRSDIFAYSGKVKVKGKVEVCCHPGRADWPACCQTSSPACCCDEQAPDFPCVDPCCGDPGNPVFTELQSLPDVQVTLTSNACSTSESDWNPVRLTDENGEYDFANCTGSNCGGNRANVRLANERIRVWCGDPYQVGGIPLPPGDMPIIVKACDNAVDFDPEVEFDLSTSGLCADYVASAYQQATEALDWLDELQPSLQIIPLPLHVVLDHATGDAESGVPGFNGLSAIRLSTITGIHDFGATATILAHEIGHLIQESLHMNLLESFSQNLGEDFPDILALLLWDTPCRGYNAQGVIDGCEVRWNPSTNARYGTYSLLQEGKDKLLGQTFWDLRTALLYCAADPEQSCLTNLECNVGPCVNNQCSDQRSCTTNADCQLGPCVDRITEQLFIDAAVHLRGMDVSYESFLPALMAVDDDDNDLCSDPPTPHYQQLHDAFVVQHGFPDPFPVDDGSVVVKWQGPEGDPDHEDCEPNCDFTVDYDFTPPVVNLISKAKGGFDVDFWRLGRIVNGQPADLGAVIGSWEEPDRTIIVEFGTVPQLVECRNAHFVSSAFSGGRSSLVFGLQGGLLGVGEAYGVNGQGGRISGTVNGEIANIVATAIGSGDAGAGSLVGSTLAAAELAILPNGSRIEVGSLTDKVTIAQASAGDIRIDGDLSGKLTIGGNMSGDIIADWDADGEGLITGQVTISGTFSGSICDAYIAANGALPTHLANLPCDPPNCDDNLCRARTPVKFKTYPHSALKNRALTINPASTYGHEVSLKITLTDMKRCSTSTDMACVTNSDCLSGETCVQHSDVNSTWWVGAPFDPSCQGEDGSPLSGNPTCTGEFVIS